MPAAAGKITTRMPEKRRMKNCDQNDVEIVKLVRSVLPAGARLLHVSVAGSRGKGLAAPDSDFDVNAIAIYPARAYMLGKKKGTVKFEGLKVPLTGGAADLEGTVTDLWSMYGYALETNLHAYEAFFSHVIYTTAEADDVEKIFRSAYQSDKIRSALSGMLRGHRKKKLAVANLPIRCHGTTTLKLACEALYVALKLLYIASSKGESPPPPYSAWDLLDRLVECRVLSDGDSGWIRAAMKQRTEEKTAQYVMTEDFHRFLDRVEKECCIHSNAATANRKVGSS